MIYNFLRNALLAWLLHAGIGFVFDSGSEASSDAPVFSADVSSGASIFAAAVPAACTMPASESVETPSSASPKTRKTLTVSPLSLLPLTAHDAFDLRILPNAARALRSTIPTFAGARL